MTINVTTKQVLQMVQFLMLSAVLVLMIWSQPWSGTSNGENKRTITVTGDATIEASPDEYMFSPYFEAKGSDKEALKTTLTEQANDAVAKLKELGVADDDIKLDLNSFDQWYWLEGEEGVATASIQVDVANKELAQKVQDFLLTTEAKGQLTPQATFSEDKQDELDDEVMKKAIEDAKKRAEQQASLLGAKLGKVVESKQSSDSVFPMAYDTGVATLEMSAPDSARSASLPVMVGQNEYTQSVTVTFELK
jgi:uncharacterized protein YggE